ncbi:MAG: hypothetical protein ACXABO_14530 [Promethearchaeota archaeon]|jgi:hypothetical protein
MDIKRAKELIKELTNMIDQIDEEEISMMNKMSEELKTEIQVKVIAILNELDIRPIKYGD